MIVYWKKSGFRNKLLLESNRSNLFLRASSVSKNTKITATIQFENNIANL